MTEEIYVNTDDIVIPEGDDRSVEKIRNHIYDSLNGEESEIAICVWMYTPKRLDKLRNCIDSVMKYTRHIKFKLVLANNGGGEEIEKYYQSIDYPDKLIINISSNISSPHGASVITRYVKNKFCVELLNDCIVTPNWLDNIMRCMRSDSRIGMVCPMSTNTSNMQIPDTKDVDLRDKNAIQEFAKEYNQSSPADWEERMRLMPICAVYRREALEMSGIADPGYLHEFMDDDHCMRIRRAGYKLMLCKDTFVHHDHFMDERNPQIETANSELGKNGFMEKFKGLDPWKDFTNFVFPYLNTVKIETAKEEYQILGIDVKCGTPILDIKNCYRRNGIPMDHLKITSYTQEVMYYTDLLTISDKVLHADIHQLRSCLDHKYDFIVLGDILNGYSNSMKVLEELISLLEQDGFLLFPIKNIYNIDMLLCLLGESRPDNCLVETLYFGNVIENIKQFGLKKALFFPEKIPYNLPEIEMVKKSLVKIGLIAEDNLSAAEQWTVQNYWFLIQK